MNTFKKHTLAVTVMASFLTPFMSSAVNLAIPSIGREFNSSAVLLSWVAMSYILAAAAFLVPFGRLADLIGRRKIFITGITIFGLSSLLCGTSWSTEVLIAFRTLQGIGSAMIFGTPIAILTSVFPPAERGRALGINVASVYIGLSLGPVLGGALNYSLGWQSIFYFTALLALLVVFLLVVGLKGEWAGARGEIFDFKGAVLYAVGMISFMYGISSLLSSDWAKYILGLGLLVLIVFIRHEINLRQPLLNLYLFRSNRTFAFSNLAALLNYSATFAVVFLLSLYLQVIVGYNSQEAGLILLSQPLVMALLSPFAGALSDRIQPRLVASWGMSLTTLALFVFCFLGENTPLWLIITNLTLMGAGFAFFSSPNTNAIMGSVGKKSYGVASSMVATMRLTGQAVSMAVVTLLLAFYVGHIELAQAQADLLVQGTTRSFLVFAVVCFGGIFASLARGDNVSSKRLANGKYSG